MHARLSAGHRGSAALPTSNSPPSQSLRIRRMRRQHRLYSLCAASAGLLVLFIFLCVYALHGTTGVLYSNRQSQLARHFAGKRVLVVQTDSRLRTLWNGEAPHSFTNKSYGPSILEVQHWAEKHGHAYLFITSPSKCRGPRGERLIQYWCKVPAVMLSVHLCTKHALEYVLYVDTDIGIPSVPNSLDVSSVVAQSPEALLFVSPAGENSSWTLWLDHKTKQKAAKNKREEPLVYSRAVNSGSLIVKCSAQGQQLIDYWWYNLTALLSPYEQLRKPNQFAVVSGEATQENTSPSVVLLQTSTLDLSLPDVSMRYSIEQDGDDTLVPELSLKPQKPASKASMAAFRALQRDLCAGEMPREILTALLNRSTTYRGNLRWHGKTVCTKGDARTSLVRWPGDQDRLNWLLDLKPNEVVMADKPKIADSDIGLSKSAGQSLFIHWWGQHKISEALLASERAKLREGGGPDWESTGGWSALRRLVARIDVDPALSWHDFIAAMYTLEGEDRYFVPAAP